MDYPFYIFGSHSSVDYDVVVFTNRLGTTKENQDFCNQQTQYLETFFNTRNLPVKKINTNIAILENGIITAVHKGTPDELNNSVLYTYSLHQQFYPLLITRAVERNWQLKMLRACRTILSFYTRTAIRSDIKLALQGDLDVKLPVLENLDITQWTEFHKNDPQDCWKTIAFQLGQALGLLENKELYTKEDIIDFLPEMSVFLNRKTTYTDLTTLQNYKNLFIKRLKEVRPLFSQLTETGASTE
ncbi:hypothetical protein QNI19_28220 [Cytophagaceae bacterium DM2B3-1]|uniref:Nucleotidyltransferase n=1 Tax=Xanthocytophaga flava TaxID=3048013 RepID=A0ABT7CW81_9BACT|nr:hypothetical protein [Xanthocytophaga flavus]MDJ1471919.1 hypothetical protein [Xanthocytophaga flavus]MDJ1496854.1 hypothetical protein [Xanthocytophaga flavus]